ncbi:MAG TPA: glucose-6-phosphate dehydrogenase assembly protein OpcA [Polyangiaceae bacterium]|jgi:glucose-6-phosphate dehydrogenase assembly protein OpcA
MKLSVDEVERAVAQLWDEEARKHGAARTELLTLVALANEPQLLERAQNVISHVVKCIPSRTIVAVWRDGSEPALTADATLHRLSPGGPACGDSITLEALGEAREWLPGNADRLALSDLPVCIWWVGDLPDHDDLFDRMVVNADVVIVNSQEMDLRDLEKLSFIAQRSRGRYALADLAWARLRWVQDLVARFFDDEQGRACLPGLERIEVQFSPREGEKDAASTRSGLLFGWLAHVLGLPTDAPQWKRGDTWAEVTLGNVVTRFEQRPQEGVRPGGIVRLALECKTGRFEIQRQDDPQAFRWSREVPGTPTPPQLLRILSLDEPTLLLRCLERPRRDPLLETSLLVGSRIVRPVAPRLSKRPPP